MGTSTLEQNMSDESGPRSEPANKGRRIRESSREECEAREPTGTSSFQEVGEAVFRGVVEAAPDGIVMADQAGRIVLVNTQAETLFGYRREELLGQPIEVLVPDRYRDVHRRHRSGYSGAPRARQMGIGLELYGRRNNGAEFPVEISLSPVEADGRILIISVIRDIAERKRVESERATLLAHAQAARAEAEQASATVQRLQSIMDGALLHLSLPELLQELLNRLLVAMAIDTAAILLLDSANDTLIRHAATGLEATFDQLVPVPVGRGFAGRIAAERCAIALADLDHVELVNPTLRERGIRSLLGVPLQIQGRLIGVVHVGTVARREFAEADTHFLQLAANRAALAIENALLYQRAQQAVQAREEFLSMAAHDLRTPLTTVMGWASMLADAVRHPDRSDPEAIKSFADELQSQVQRLDTMIDDLLDASRIQQNRIELRLEQTDLVSLVQRVVARFEHAPERRPSHQLIFDHPAALIGCWDPTRLEQIVVNLVSNALKYSPQGGEIRVGVAQAGTEAALTVQDHGIGMSPEELAHVFEPFRRADTARRVASGSGLGLHITQQLVEQHGGSIVITSTPGSSTTATVRLPLQRDC
jgi:PAS domain S-box-containing protein